MTLDFCGQYGKVPSMTVREVELTPREEQILKAMVDGLSISELAEEFGIAPRTAKHHSDMLRVKFGVKHRRELVKIARLRNGEAS